MVTSHWPRLHGWPNKEPYFRDLVKSYFCPALFSVDDPDTPIAFVVTFPCFQQFGWTNEKYRGKYILKYTLLLLIIDLILMNQLYPLEGEISPTRLEYQIRIGGIPAGYNVKDLIIMDNALSSNFKSNL